jgi:hypothetical protein
MRVSVPPDAASATSGTHRRSAKDFSYCVTYSTVRASAPPAYSVEVDTTEITEESWSKSSKASSSPPSPPSKLIWSLSENIPLNDLKGEQWLWQSNLLNVSDCIEVTKAPSGSHDHYYNSAQVGP